MSEGVLGQSALARIEAAEKRLAELDALTEDRLARLDALADQAPELTDLTVRAVERRSRTGRAAGEVQKNDMTLDEARLMGLRRSVVSALRAHENSTRLYKSAKAEFERTLGDVKMCQELTEAFLEEHPELK